MLEAIQLGRNSGLSVSQLCLGTMNFGEPGRGHQRDWTLGLDDARPIFQAAIDKGLFYFDCADVYGRGACEKVVGQLLRELLPRDEYVISSKIGRWLKAQERGQRSESVADAAARNMSVANVRMGSAGGWAMR